MEIAKEAYEAYGKSVDFKNYLGTPMPEWRDLPVAIKDAWHTAVMRIMDIMNER